LFYVHSELLKVYFVKCTDYTMITIIVQILLIGNTKKSKTT